MTPFVRGALTVFVVLFGVVSIGGLITACTAGSPSRPDQPTVTDDSRSLYITDFTHKVGNSDVNCIFVVRQAGQAGVWCQ